MDRSASRPEAGAPTANDMTTICGVRVVDLSDGVAGQFAARILADYGADVMLVEPPGGSATRRIEPFDPNANACQPSLLFQHVNVGKRFVTLERPLRDSADHLAELADQADVIVLEDAGVAQALTATRPQLITCCITDFSPKGPYAQWKGCELVHQALGGLMFMTGREGEEPLYGFGHRAYYSAGAAAAATMMAALVERQRSGLGQALTISVHETAAAMSQHVVAQYSYSATFPHRGAYPTGGVDTFRCRDGWIALYCRADRWTALCDELGAPELGADPRYATDLFARNWPEAHRRISPYFASLSVAKALRVIDAARCVTAKVMSMADVLDCEHLRARYYWSLRHDGEGRVALGPLFRMSRTRGVGASPSRGLATTGGQNDPEGAREPPLAGIRILELTTAWAGPMLGRILAEFGAEVIKLESPVAMDVFRGPPKGGSPTQYPDGVPGDAPFNRAVAFNSQNIGKLSVAIDLKSPVARPALQTLVRSADVVVCNLAPRSLRNLGFDAETLRALRQDIIVIEMPAAGSGGPLSEIAGVGHTMEALAGMTGLQGYDDGAPQRTGPAYLDPIGALNGAVAVLMALYARAQNGDGWHIELAQREAAMHWLGEWLLLQQRGTAPEAPRGNARAGAAPHGAFRTRGEDEWIAIGVFSDGAWRALCDELQLPLASDTRFETAAGREVHAAALRVELERRTRDCDKHDLARRLQARGVCAAPVCSGKDLHGDPHLAASGFFLELDHPAAGRRRYHGLPFRMSAHPRRQPAPAPLLGEHTALILSL